MVSTLCTELFVSKNETKKKQALSLLSKIEVFVNGAGGKYSSTWKDASEGYDVQLDIEVTDRSLLEEINHDLIEIEKCMNDDFADNPVERQQKQISSETIPVGNDESLEGPCTSSQLQEGRTKNSDKKQKNRSKHDCPFPQCNSSVVHLPRHMRKSHGWSPKKSRTVLNSFGLRGKKSKDKRKTKRTYKSVMCPVDECHSVVMRLQNHLTDVHKMKTGSKIYKKCLSIAVRHEVPPISASESWTESSDVSTGSSDSYKPPQKKTNVYDIVYGTDDAKSEGDMVSDNDGSGLNYPSFNSNDNSLEWNDPECEAEISEDKDAHDVNAADFDKELRGVFDRFESWLQCADGGRRGGRSAAQCRRQVELVVSYIDSSNPSFTGILQKSLLREKWLNKFEQEKMPGTVKSYLGSLAQFYSFLKCEDIDVGASSEQLSNLSQQAKLWASSFRKKSKDRFWVKRMEDVSTMKTPEQVREFDTSKVAREAVRLLGEYQDTEDELKPTQPEFTSVRDYLLTSICINNASRSGSLANMTLGEFEKATEDDGCFEVKVKNHKTFTEHGPANVVFTTPLYKYTQIFVEKFRNQLDGASTNPNSAVFLTVTNKKLNSSQVGTQIGSCWGKVFGKEASSGGATAFRKAAVSAVHECREDLRGDLANLMVHKPSTADRYYLLQNKGKSAVKTSKELTKIMRQGTEKESTNNAIDDKPTDHSPRRHKWTSGQTAELQSAFASHINRQSITTEEVRKTVKNVPALKGICTKKILDKIRSYFGENARESEQSESLPAEQETLAARLKRAFQDKPRIADDLSSHDIMSQDELISDERDAINPHGDDDRDEVEIVKEDHDDEYVPPSIWSSKKTMQSLLTVEEEEIFSATFSKLIKSSRPISVKEVVAVIKKEAKLCHLLEKLTDRQLTDRVRSIRKATVRGNKRNNMQRKYKK